MLQMMFRFFLLTVLLLPLLATADVSECVEIKRDKKRLACYDALFLPEAEQEDALGQEHLPQQAAERNVREIDSFSARVTRLERRSRSEMVFHLDNDQVWTQTSPRFISVSEGDEITIKRSRLGSYALRTAKGASTKVKRLR